jgi:predicted AAA+ superfamily ATPase
MIKDVGLFKFATYLYFEMEIREIYVDEVHKYANRRDEIKNIYDHLPDMKVVFSGSSSLDLYKGMLDLLRRTDFYIVNPMNYSEYLKFFHNIDIPTVNFLELLANHKKIALQYGDLYRDRYFTDFLQKGQYPYIKTLEEEDFVVKFQTLFDKVIIEDLPVFLNAQTTSLDKLRRLLYFISNTPPSELSFNGLSQKIVIDKAIIENSLTLLNKI